jgi:hypothetical protein
MYQEELLNVIYGSGKHSYELVDDWAKLPEGGSFRDVCGMSIDRQKRIYVLNRSERRLGVKATSPGLMAAVLAQTSPSTVLMI